MTQEQIHILELSSSEDNANVQLGLELLQSQNITIPILEKFSKKIAMWSLLMTSFTINHMGNKDASIEEKNISNCILHGALTLSTKDFTLNILALDKDDIKDEILHLIGNLPYMASKYFINFSKEEEHA